MFLWEQCKVQIWNFDPDLWPNHLCEKSKTFHRDCVMKASRWTDITVLSQDNHMQHHHCTLFGVCIERWMETGYVQNSWCKQYFNPFMLEIKLHLFIYHCYVYLIILLHQLRLSIDHHFWVISMDRSCLKYLSSFVEFYSAVSEVNKKSQGQGHRERSKIRRSHYGLHPCMASSLYWFMWLRINFQAEVNPNILCHLEEGKSRSG